MPKIVAGAAMIAGGVTIELFSPGNPYGISLIVSGVSTEISGIIDQLATGIGDPFSTRQPAAPRQMIYGQMRVAGTIVFMSTTGHQLNAVYVWAGHPCESIDALYLDGRKVHLSLSGSGNGDGNTYYDDAGNKYSFGTEIAVFHTAGSSAGYWFSQLHGNDPKWTSDCTLNNLCASYVKTTYDANKFAGIPNAKATIHGKNDIYDPRTATSGWTDNAALIIADFLCNKEFGVGCDYASEIDEPTLIAAANICDELVALASASAPLAWQSGFPYNVGDAVLDSNGNTEVCVGFSGSNSPPISGGSAPTWNVTVGGITADRDIEWQNKGVTSGAASEKRYTINGAFDTSRTPGDILESMLLAMEGKISYSGGRWKIFPAAWYGPTFSFGPDDLAGGVKWTTKRKYRDLVNAVRATYISPLYPYAVIGFDKDNKDDNIFAGEWQPTDAPEYAQDAGHGYSSDANLAADGGNKLYLDVQYQFVTSVATAQRLMKIRLLRNRQQGAGTLTMKLSALQAQAVDVIEMSFPALKWVNKYLEVKNLRFIPKVEKNDDGSVAPSLQCELDVIETDPSVYDWSTAEERGVQNTSSPAIARDWDVAPVSGLALSSSSATAVIGLDGVATPRILAAWTEPDDPFVVAGGHIEVQYQLNGASDWISVGKFSGDTDNCYIAGVVSGQAYNVRVLAVRASGADSGWVSAGPHTVSTTLSSFSTSTILNPQGSMPPQSITASATIMGVLSSGAAAAQVTVVAGTAYRSDGSTVSIPGSGPTTSTTWNSATLAYSTNHNGNVVWNILAGATVVQQFDGNATAQTKAQAFLDGNFPIAYGINFTTPTSGGSGGGGGGGIGCFSGPVEVQTADGGTSFEEFKRHPQRLGKVVGPDGAERDAVLLEHEGFVGELIRFDPTHPEWGVTPEHGFRDGVGGWISAAEKFAGCERFLYAGPIYTLCVLDVEEFDLAAFRLATGDIAHNLKIQ